MAEYSRQISDFIFLSTLLLIWLICNKGLLTFLLIQEIERDIILVGLKMFDKWRNIKKMHLTKAGRVNIYWRGNYVKYDKFQTDF